jgi:hypothetical protein
VVNFGADNAAAQTDGHINRREFSLCIGGTR